MFEFEGAPHSYFAYLMEDPELEQVFFYSVFAALLEGKVPRKGKAAAAGADESGKLPYRVEMWSEGEFERVLALSAQATLACAIYAAAISEHPDRLIVLARGAKILARSAD